MKLELAYYGHPILRQKAKEVTAITDEVLEFIEGMKDVLIETQGLGLSAPQVYRSERIILIRPPVPGEDEETWEKGEITVLINPKLLSLHKQTWFSSEGCLSIPKVYADVERPIAINIEAMDVEGNIFQTEYRGWPARIFLHEHDHLNGVLFIDRIHGQERKEMEKALREIKKKYAHKI